MLLQAIHNNHQENAWSDRRIATIVLKQAKSEANSTPVTPPDQSQNDTEAITAVAEVNNKKKFNLLG